MQWRCEHAGLGWEAAPDEYPGVRFDFQRIHETGDDTKSDLTVYGPEVGTFDHPNFNLRSVRTRESVGKMLNERSSTFRQWVPLIHEVCTVVLKVLAQGEPGWDVDVDEVTVRPVDYLVEPILPKGGPAIMFGPAGTSKSYLALALAASTATGRTFIPDLLPIERGPVVYLDYEMSADSFGIRLKRLLTPFGIGGKIGVRRLAMTRPVADDLTRVARSVSDTGAKLVIVDPSGPAAGAATDWTRDDSRAESLYGALRLFGATSLLIDHVTKAELRNGGGKASGAPIGSVVKYNRARSVWEVRRSEEATSDNDVFVSMTHWKANDDRIRKPMGYVVHHGDGVTIERADLRELADASQSAPINVMILDALRTGTPMTPADLADELRRKPASIRQALSRLARKGEVIRFDNGTYALLAQGISGGERVN